MKRPSFPGLCPAAPLSLVLGTAVAGMPGAIVSGETLEEVQRRVGTEAQEAYRKGPYAFLSLDYFARFSRDPEAQAGEKEIQVEAAWSIVLPDDSAPLGIRMAEDLADFLRRAMGITVQRRTVSRLQAEAGLAQALVLLDRGGGEEAVPESFTVTVEQDRIRIAGRDPAGLRDGVVALVDRMGFRQAPFLEVGTTTYKPRLAVRLGTKPWLGTYREAAFLGYNAVMVSGVDLHRDRLVTSGAIAELAGYFDPQRMETLAQEVKAAKVYGLRCYLVLNTTKKFGGNHPVVLKRPEILGSLQKGNEYSLCTEHPLVKQYLAECIGGFFEKLPDLDGFAVIVGGEGFYHCFMRPVEVCKRCKAVGADQVVANLCNHVAAAIRSVQPKGELLAWTYSANWASDTCQRRFISLLKPGTALLTEPEKDEIVYKTMDGVKFHKKLWDYSIEWVGLGPRALAQRAACRQAGIPLYLKTEPELTWEAPGLPHAPCLNRWLQRSEALAASGAKGACMVPYIVVYNSGTSAAEIYKYAFWDPVPDQALILQRLAARIAGPEAGPRLCAAWKAVSEAIPCAPEIPPYFVGPYFLGPAHPMLANPRLEPPQVFRGRVLFYAEEGDRKGLEWRPTWQAGPHGGAHALAFEKMYREMERHLKDAADAVKAAEALVPPRCQRMFKAEVSSILWFYATARTQANFYESCRLRGPMPGNFKRDYPRWQAVLQDERENARQALALLEDDVRLNFKYRLHGTEYRDGREMLREKMKLIEFEIETYLPSLLKP